MPRRAKPPPLTVRQRHLVKRNRGLAYRAARRSPWRLFHRLPLEDCEQAAFLGLCRAAQLFDPARGYQFSTYAWWHMKTAIQRHAGLYRQKGGEPGRSVPTVQLGTAESLTTLDTLAVSGDVSVSATIELQELFDAAELTPRQRQALTLRYGLFGGRPHLYWEVGAALGVTKERARQFADAAVARLREVAGV